MKLVGNELLNLYNGITLKQIFRNFKLNCKYLDNENTQKIFIMNAKVYQYFEYYGIYSAFLFSKMKEKTICTSEGNVIYQTASRIVTSKNIVFRFNDEANF